MCKIIAWKVLFPLLFLHNFLAHLHAQIAQQSIQSVDWYNIHSVLNSIGQWQLQVPEQFVRNKMMPFIQQFRRQLNPMTEIISMQNGGISSAHQLNPNNPNQVARFSHVDLNPPEQRAYRNGPASTREDLAGMIVREMWRKAKTHCVQCSSTGSRGQCELVNPGCGYPYQLFDDQARQIHCTVILRKESGRTQLHAQMECNTLPATPSLMGSVLATNYQRNWRWMCVNCTPSVYPALNNGNNIPWKNRANNSNAYGRIDLNNNNGGGGGAVANDAWADAYYTGVGQRNVLRVWTDRKYSRIYQISNAEGSDIARFINRVRAEIARGEAPNLPVAAAMNQIKWKPSLASEAQRQLYSRDNDAVNIIDLEFTLLIPNARRAGLVSGRGQNFVDLDAHSLLLWTVRNYLEMFTNQQGLQCTSNGTCKATCRKGSQRTRVIPWQRMAENPADFHCYPYELLYDRAHSIGCAVRFVTKQRTHLQAKMVCVIEHQQGRNGSVRRMMHRHNVYKVGTACSRCENSHYCDQRTKLCVARNALQRGYEPIERLKLSSDNFDNVTAYNGNDRRGVGYGGAGGGGGVAFNNNFNVNEDGDGAWPPYGPNNGNGERYGRNGGRFVGRNNNGNIYNNNNNNFDTNGLYGGVGDGGYGGSGMPGAFGMTGFRGGFDNGIGGNYMGGGGGNGFPTAGGGYGGGNGNFAGNNGYPPNYDGIDPVIRRR